MSDLSLIEPRRLVASSPEQIRALMAQVQEMRRSLLIEGVDYGTLPGTKRPTLFAAGADKMALLGGLGHEVELVEQTEMGVRYRCTVKRAGQIVAQCEGYAGFDEDRFFQTAEQLQRKAEKEERYYAAKDQRPIRPQRFAAENFDDYRAPWNTLLKMAQKRAKVGAISSALALSGLFDIDSDDEPATTVDQPPGGSVEPPSRPGPPARRQRYQRERVPDSVYESEPEAQPRDPGRVSHADAGQAQYASDDEGRPFE